MAHTEESFEPLMNGGIQYFRIGELDVGDKQSGRLVKGVFQGVHTENEPIMMDAGLVKMEDGSKFAGFFEDNEKDYGVQFFANGVKYFGSFYEDKPEKGIAVFPDGAVMITNEFDENGNMTKGLFYWPDGKRWLNAIFQDGIAVWGDYVEDDVVSSISEECSIDLRHYHI